MARLLGWYVALCAGLYIAQTLSPPQTVLRYSQQAVTGGETRIWATTLFVIFLGALAMFAYQLQARPRPALWVIFAASAVAIVMSQGRLLTTVFAMSLGTMLLHRAIVTNRIGLAIRVAATTLVVLLACTAVLWSAGRLDPLIDVWNKRLGEFEVDVRAHEGSWTSRAEMFQYLPLIMSRNGGGLFAPWFGMGLRALTPTELAPMTFWGTISPPIWADNGLAGTVFTAGYFGLLMLAVFVATMVWHLLKQFARVQEPLCRSVTFAAALYFAFILPYMFFSAAFLGTWDDALAIVVVLILAERLALPVAQRSLRS